MTLDVSDMHRAGLAFMYRIISVLVATILYGIYIAILCVATRGLIHHGRSSRANLIILAVLYIVFILSSALWALEAAQLMGLVQLLLSPDGLSTNDLFNRFYNLIARETKVTGILFECQMIVGDILVIWRTSAVWFDRKAVVFLPLLWWTLLVVDTIVQAAYCQSGVSTTDYSHLCKVTNILGPTLSITTNFSVTVLIAWRGWMLRATLLAAWQGKQKNRLLTLFVLLIESGTLYVIMLMSDLLVTSLVTGGNETVGRMIDCISGYASVQLVGIYPTLMLVILRESVWNAHGSSAHAMSVNMSYRVSEPSPLDSVDVEHTGSGGHQSHLVDLSPVEDARILGKAPSPEKRMSAVDL